MTAHASQPRDTTVAVRFTENGVAKVDEMRGAWSRSEYIRQAVAFAVKHGKVGPEPVQKQDEIRW